MLMAQKQSLVIFWFRRDLRLDDNTALEHALDTKYPVLPIFIFDTNILAELDEKKDARVEFIHQEILQIKNKLEQHNSSLAIFHDTPKNVFKNLHDQYDIKKVFANKDYEPYAIQRDKEIQKFLSDQKIDLHLFKDHIIFEGKEILKQDGTPYKVFTPFKKLWLDKFNEINLGTTQSIHFDRFLKIDPLKEISVDDLGFVHSEIEIPAKEPNVQIIDDYDRKRDFPAINGTTRLGIHLRFGSVSIRKMVKLAKKRNQTWLNELIWREFYSAILQHFPHVTKEAFNKKYDKIPWRNDESEFKKWCEGKTGFPIVDAGMRQLNQTGYMHNRVRMITASFLTKHLLVDWRWGEAYFANKLLDYELASNNGGWQWAAGTGTDAQPYFRVFNPESQTQKFDPKLDYIKKWVPEINSNSYPEPMVNHKQARNRAIETYKQAIS